jgi:uncharacterized protein
MRAITVTALLIALGGCSDSGAARKNAEDPSDASVIARRAALSSIGERVILKTYRDLSARAEALEDAAAAWQAAPKDEAMRQAAQAAWRDAMASLQQAELFQLGPAGPMGVVAAGEDRRAQLYSWPLVNACRVDQELLAQRYSDQAALSAQPVNVRGLDALEYLLHHDAGTNACAPNAAINASGQWAALPADELPARRAAYALALTRDLRVHADALRDRWEPTGGDFLAELTGAGLTSETWSSSQEALDAIFAALFYLDKETKDMKLALPAGIMGCEVECADKVESLHADASHLHVLANLRGFSAIYHGGERADAQARGFDDLLRGVGAVALADELDADIEAALIAVEALGPSLRAALAQDPARVVAAHAAVRKITDNLKTELVAVLDLELPQRAEGDND